MLQPTLITVLVSGQAIGAAIGAFTAVWAHRAYIKAMRDGKIDHAEQAHLTYIGHGLRYGMALLLLSSLGLVIASYMAHNTTQPALTPSYWTLIAFALILISTASMLARRRAPFKLASATIFTAWWFLVYLSFGWLSFSFGSALMSFVVVTAIFYGVLHYTHLLAQS
jgi:hypothetical protein